MKVLKLKYDQQVPSNLKCVCGHPYERHFDTYMGDTDIYANCKWCDGGEDHCFRFRPSTSEGVRLIRASRIRQLKARVKMLKERLTRSEAELFRVENAE